jgi:hypothetical protein
VPFSDVAKTFDEQVLHAIDLVRAERFVSAAAVIAQMHEIERTHLSAVLIELERQHAHNAIVALELIHAVYRRPRLLS